MELAGALQVAREVAEILERLGVSYLVGGSLASSLHGIPRSTQDADLVVALQAHHVRPLVEALSGSFYVDEEQGRNAVRRRSSFNVIHLATLLKIDLFVLSDDLLARQEMARRQLDQDYLRSGALHLEVADLLDRALSEAGTPSD